MSRRFTCIGRLKPKKQFSRRPYQPVSGGCPQAGKRLLEQVVFALCGIGGGGFGLRGGAVFGDRAVAGVSVRMPASVSASISISLPSGRIWSSAGVAALAAALALLRLPEPEVQASDLSSPLILLFALPQLMQ